jgi:UDP-N-acetylmuramoyl-L-alanyl-D-glutamate--2,6-diaminopimelate ligase
MRLSYLLKNLYSLPAQADKEIARLVLDSRQVAKGDVFFAIKGTHSDGREYITKAILQGAAAVLVDAESKDEPLRFEQEVPLIPLYRLQQQVGHLAALFYGYPAKTLRVIGVTGTSGKTSCTHFLAQTLQALHVPCGLIGTLGSGFYGALHETGLTTPDAVTLQANLQQLQAKGAKAIAMEVSSHSIEQGRVNGIPFDIAIFTNLSQDHLDYHGDMPTYAAVKRRFMLDFPVKHRIINAEDVHGLSWLVDLAPRDSLYAYSTRKLTGLPESVLLIYTEHIELTLQGIQAEVITPWGRGRLTLPLIGAFNLSNALAVLTALCLYGIPFEEAITQLAKVTSVPGRMQLLGGGAHPLIVVDYAHKPDALEKVLEALRSHTKGRLVCVFGCGGERDHGKRPMMAGIAERLADQVIVTNDNPRHEQPEAIAKDILRGFSHPERVHVMLDRSKAIENSIQWASAQDCILIAGKGAERYQQIGDDKIPFDDVQKVVDYLEGQ